MWRMIPSNDWIGGLADAADATAAESDDSTVWRVSASNRRATVMAPARDVVARLQDARGELTNEQVFRPGENSGQSRQLKLNLS